MMDTQLNIPKRINVGCQKRQGTYTGKLAYVIYFDAKGKLRKENSWNGWRDKDIPNEIFDNEPTDGFVLNKKVGDYRSRYGGRNAWIRIYDPRGFEFEISVQNLIFILEECSSIKGKGLEGEFIYAWSGKDLVLLPVGSLEYNESIKFTELQTKKITKKDMAEGCLYKSKQDDTYMYLGRLPWYEPPKSYYGRYTSEDYGYKLKEKKRHVYYDIKAKKYITKPGFTWLAERLDEQSSNDFANRYEDFKNSKYAGSFSKFVIVKMEDKSARFSSYIKVKDEYFHVNVARESYYNNGRYNISTATRPVKIEGESINVPRANYMPYYGTSVNYGEVLSKSRLQSMDFYSIFIESKNGDRVQI